MKLFAPYQLGNLSLANRVVMAPMTRSRAIGGIPNALMREYYRQRASAGLIITEGTAPSPDGLGYARIPGLFSEEQVAGWREITDAVHAEGGKIIAQLMHVGRIAHPANMPAGARIVAPSAVAAQGAMWTDTQGMQPMPVPVEMTMADLAEARDGFVHASKNAIRAGFDGVELHGANGYLLTQFLQPHSNRRTDQYGGSHENRARFVLEVVDATAAAIGADQVGIRLSPMNPYNDVGEHPDPLGQFTVLARGLRGLRYVHIVSASPASDVVREAIQKTFEGPIIDNGNFDATRAEAAIQAGTADLIAFGRPFIGNPDFVRRAREGLPLAEADHSVFFAPGPEGFTDWPTAS